MLITLFLNQFKTVSHGDPSLRDGKNLANFLFLYVVGNSLNKYKSYWERIKYSYLIAVYIVLNIVLVVSYLLSGSASIISKIVWELSFPYCSPVLLINALLLFMIIGKVHLHSSKINYLASSTLAIYLIHSQPVILDAIGKVVPMLKDWSFNDVTFLLLMVCYALAIMFVSILVDKVLQPIWNYINRIGNTANVYFYRFIG